MTAQAPNTTPVRRPSDRQEAPRTRPANFGGPRLKLSVAGEIPGYHLFWENDEDGRVEYLQECGFELVQPSEISLNAGIVADKDVGGRVTRFVGHQRDNTPLRAVLLKCTDEIWAEMENQRYDAADAKDASIRRGDTLPDPAQYRPKSANISLNTQSKGD